MSHAKYNVQSSVPVRRFCWD